MPDLNRNFVFLKLDIRRHTCTTVQFVHFIYSLEYLYTIKNCNYTTSNVKVSRFYDNLNRNKQ